MHAHAWTDHAFTVERAIDNLSRLDQKINEEVSMNDDSLCNVVYTVDERPPELLVVLTFYSPLNEQLHKTSCIDRCDYVWVRDCFDTKTLPLVHLKRHWFHTKTLATFHLKRHWFHSKTLATVPLEKRWFHTKSLVMVPLKRHWFVM